jgi:LAO/AO transport system kinase
LPAVGQGRSQIADPFVVNKADRPGVEKTMAELERMAQRRHLSTALQMKTTVEAQDNEYWEVPIKVTVATSAKGIEDVINAIEAYQTFLSTPDTGVRSHPARIQTALCQRTRQEVARRIEELTTSALREEAVDRIGS